MVDVRKPFFSSAKQTSWGARLDDALDDAHFLVGKEQIVVGIQHTLRQTF